MAPFTPKIADLQAGPSFGTHTQGASGERRE
jgi:hypothetical protein